MVYYINLWIYQIYYCIIHYDLYVLEISRFLGVNNINYIMVCTYLYVDDTVIHLIASLLIPVIPILLLCIIRYAWLKVNRSGVRWVREWLTWLYDAHRSGPSTLKVLDRPIGYHWICLNQLVNIMSYSSRIYGLF